ncbi:MAG: VIT1/CCC1 transporter family protein [Flavobacteriales bacterium]|nr:VIT1/CCC1 transporter family protein [Flavobacteriales bacterium]MCB9166825.1 VIT1/CCC1 transporter family protein [Flavobacteriales bacterium]
MPRPTPRLRKQSLRTEIDAAWLYGRVADHEADPDIARLFGEMARIERGHADHAFRDLSADGLVNEMPGPTWQARLLDRIGGILGYEHVIAQLMDTEKGLARASVDLKRRAGEPLSGSEENHVRILRSLLANKSRVGGEQIGRIEGRHRTVGGNALRAAVLGANDGLVSNMSLVMGVAGATAGEEGVLLAGLAGLLAGALSMALGEWISVKSSQELYERQMALEMVELETNPEGERKELALIYMAKGIPEADAQHLATELIADKEKAHAMLVKEELGINAEDLKGSAWEAAITSFLLFAAGAILPVLPFLFIHGARAIAWSIGASAVGLFLIGAAITLFTGRSIWYSGMRQVLFGLAAAAITFGIGHLIGVSVAG